MINDAHLPAATFANLEDGLFWDVAYVLMESRRDRKQIQPRCKDNLVEMGWTRPHGLSNLHRLHPFRSAALIALRDFLVLALG